MTVQYFNQRGFTILNNNANDRNEKEQHLTDKYVTNIKKKIKNEKYGVPFQDSVIIVFNLTKIFFSFFIFRSCQFNLFILVLDKIM